MLAIHIIVKSTYSRILVQYNADEFYCCHFSFKEPRQHIQLYHRQKDLCKRNFLKICSIGFTYIVVVKIRNSLNEELKVVARELLSN